MTYFTDSVYEKMMVQKPRYGWEKTSPALNDKRRKKEIILREKRAYPYP